MNGLQSLMASGQQPQQPQQPPMPAQNDPRMAAAMDVVEGNIPESLRQVVSQSEFAQKAIELLQSAGGQAAMNQPPVTPPTVKQRVDQKAAEGVAGLLSRLAPGMQQRGKQMQTEQNRQMVGNGGGMPTMSAPNMERMADGGIIGYAEGNKVKPRGPIPNMSPEENAMVLEYLKGRKKFDYFAKNPDKVSPEYRAAFEQDRANFESQFSPEFRQKIESMLRGPVQGMAGGGGVNYRQRVPVRDMVRGGIYGMAGGGTIAFQQGGATNSSVDDTAGSNNPYNIRFDAGNDWNGQGNPTSSGFATFDNLNSGTRAADRVLRTYGRGGISTITDLVKRYAPPNENDTANYIKFVSDQTGIPSNQPIDLEDPGTRSKILAALGKMESGRNDTPEDIAARIAAVDSAGQDGGQNGTPEDTARIDEADALDDIIGTRTGSADPANRVPSTATEQVPTSGYGRGDNTGQASTLMGVGRGMAGLIMDGITEAIAGLYANQAYPRGAYPTGDPTLLAEATSVNTNGNVEEPVSPSTDATTDATIDPIAALMKDISDAKVGTADPSTMPRSDLRDLIESIATGNLNLNAEQARLDEEERQRALATAAYGMSPEMKAAYARQQQESDAYYTAQLDPKRLRDQKINALLKGLSSSNSIAQSGIAALEGTTAVDDNAMEARRQQTEGRFANLKEQEGINRESRTAAYGAGREAGQSAYERTSAGVNQALQTLSQLATSQETAALDKVYKDYEMRMGVLSSQLSVLMSREKLAADDQNVVRQILSDTRDAINHTENTIADLKGQGILTSDADAKTQLNSYITRLVKNSGDMQDEVAQLLLKLGITPGQTGGGGTDSSNAPPGFILD